MKIRWIIYVAFRRGMLAFRETAEKKKGTDGDGMAAQGSCTSFGSYFSIVDMPDIVNEEDPACFQMNE